MTHYQGTVDETKVGELMVAFGEMVKEAGEVGFVLTYHAVDAPGMGKLNLAGNGISQQQLGILLAAALDHNAAKGCTT